MTPRIYKSLSPPSLVNLPSSLQGLHLSHCCPSAIPVPGPSMCPLFRQPVVFCFFWGGEGSPRSHAFKNKGLLTLICGPKCCRVAGFLFHRVEEGISRTQKDEVK